MTEEERMMARFAKERRKHHEKSSVFNLEEDEDEIEAEEMLTHLGKVRDISSFACAILTLILIVIYHP